MTTWQMWGPANGSLCVNARHAGWASAADMSMDASYASRAGDRMFLAATTWDTGFACYASEVVDNVSATTGTRLRAQ